MLRKKNDDAWVARYENPNDAAASEQMKDVAVGAAAGERAAGSSKAPRAI